MGAVKRICAVPGGMADRGEGQCYYPGKSRAEIRPFGGVIGAGITWTVIKSMEQAGTCQSGASHRYFTQLIVAYVMKALGLFGVDKEPLEWRKIIGMVIALIGVAIFPMEIVQ